MTVHDRVKLYKEERKRMADKVVEISRMVTRSRMYIYFLMAIQLVEIVVLLYLLFSYYY